MSKHLQAATRIEQLERRLQMVSATVRDFAEATTDYTRLLEVVVARLAEVVKDGCVLRLLNDDGWLSPVAIHLPFEQRVGDSALIERLRAHIARPHHISEQSGARTVLSTGEALVVEKIDIQHLRASATDDIVHAYEAIGIHSYMLVALRARGVSLGLLALVRFQPDSPPYTQADRDLAQVLADNASLAVSNARLFQAAMRDLAERERAERELRLVEEQLRHAQKMEAVGRLAGSVAHDFNNLLSVILGHASLITTDLNKADPMHAEVSAIVAAGERAADLTRQLLAFGRQQVLQPRVLDLNLSLRGCERMLRRLLGADIELIIRYASTVAKVIADPGQIDQVIMNLVINARDAMPAGGKLTLETMDVLLDDAYAHEHLDVIPGPHVMLAVSDTGVGMTKATQARIFEPFFTTKELGKGTGLGLSTVFGIVKQSGGHIWVYSEPGKGSTFKVYFPRASSEGEPLDVPPLPKPITLRGTETILLVEDQDDVRQIALQILLRYGYHVIEARNAGEALLSCEQHPRKIHLLLTDVVMPKLNGRLLADRLLKIRPDMTVLFMSGYTENAIVHHGILDSGISYLTKPFLPETLARRVREVLDNSRKVGVPEGEQDP